MAAASCVELVDGLPAAGVLLDLRGDRASVFADLRAWVKARSSRGDLQAAGRLVDEKYRCALVCRIARESTGGVRRHQALELLRILAEVPEWTPQTQMSLSDLEAEAAKAAQQPAPAVSAAVRAAMRESLGNLPTRGRLEDPQYSSEAFSELYSWVKARQRTLPSLAEAGRMIDVGHRRGIFAFLCGFLARRNSMSSRCREVLSMLANTEEWCAGDAADQTALAEALAHSRGLRIQGLGAEVTATVSAPDFGASSSAKAASYPALQSAHADIARAVQRAHTDIARAVQRAHTDIARTSGRAEGALSGCPGYASPPAVMAEVPSAELSLSDFERLFLPAHEPASPAGVEQMFSPNRHLVHLQTEHPAARDLRESQILQVNMWA